MRMTLVACLVFTGVVGASKASNTGYPVTDSWAAVDAVRAMAHAEITRDVELLEPLLADGYKEITSHGEVMNRKETLEFYSVDSSDYQFVETGEVSVKLEDVVIEVADAYVIVVARKTITTMDVNESKLECFRASFLLENREQAWLIKQAQYTPLIASNSGESNSDPPARVPAGGARSASPCAGPVHARADASASY